VTSTFPQNFAEIGSITLQPDGKIVAAGDDDSDSFALARYNTNGTADTTFGSAGQVVTYFSASDGSTRDIAYANAVKVQSNGQIIAGGSAASYGAALARYNSNGTLELRFGSEGKAKINSERLEYIDALALQADGKLIAVGPAFEAVTVNGYFRDFGLARYLTAGERASVMRGDFDADWFPDYILFNAMTRRSAVWYLQSNNFIGGAFGPALPTGWIIAATADVNLDGNPDYILFNPATHQSAVWYLDNATLMGAAYGPTLPSGWSLVAAVDINADMKPDFVLFNSNTGQTSIWYMNGTAFTAGTFGSTLPPGWTLVDANDFNGDGRPDLLLANSSTRQTGVRYLNGPTSGRRRVRTYFACGLGTPRLGGFRAGW
jgi:uncharacterized delta-60 repeat protein